MRAARSLGWRDNGLAVALAVLLTLVWAWRDWAALSALRLPDTDDVMRLQQIRDWLGGQGFGDLAQHRLGAAGLEMHWSRLPDLVPGALIALLTPLVGAQGAELAAVILWPLLLFIAALMLVGAIARRVAAPGPAAILVAALAWPANALFLPGRIDHHGVQLVLLLMMLRAVIGGGGWRGGVVAGVASTLSLAIGMETAPFLALGGVVLAVRWWREGADERARLLGYGLSLGLSLALAGWVLRTGGWAVATCDGFAAPLWRAAQCAALAPLLLGIASPVLNGRGQRGVALVLIGGAAMMGAVALSPVCLSPYSGVDPLLARLWLGRVAEAQPLLHAPLNDAIGYAGLALVGAGAALWQWYRRRTQPWAILLAFQLLGLALALFQLRGVYAATLLAAPALAALIGAARERGPLALAAAWIASAGLTYPALGALVAPPPVPRAACDGGALLAMLRDQPVGTLAAPIDLGAYAIATTGHRVLAAPYHRNGAANLAVYRLVAAPPDRARAIARRWRIDYLAVCPGAWDELGTPPSVSLRARLRADSPPRWLIPVAKAPGATLYRIDRR